PMPSPTPAPPAPLAIPADATALPTTATIAFVSELSTVDGCKVNETRSVAQALALSTFDTRRGVSPPYFRETIDASNAQHHFAVTYLEGTLERNLLDLWA